MNALAALATLVVMTTEQVRDVEERAFTAVEAQRWCEAMSLFVEANALAPTADLVYNAARAAELANDRRRAVLLYTEVIATHAAGTRRAEAKGKLSAIAELVEVDGPGTPCASPAQPDLNSVFVAVTEPARPDPLTELTQAPPQTIYAKPPELPVPWSTVAFTAGGVFAAAGVVTTMIGVAPWLDYLGAQEELRDLEAARSSAVIEAYERQALAEGRWNDYGRATATTGLGLVTAGALFLVTGSVLLMDE